MPPLNGRKIKNSQMNIQFKDRNHGTDKEHLFNRETWTTGYSNDTRGEKCWKLQLSSHWKKTTSRIVSWTVWTQTSWSHPAAVVKRSVAAAGCGRSLDRRLRQSVICDRKVHNSPQGIVSITCHCAVILDVSIQCWLLLQANQLLRGKR